ncbi:hypothetical protein FJ365_01615 [Candidatus Dependentiae bacterium]|nr:hypothetical protein [Candidatus Dependentiae bacterium]
MKTLFAVVLATAMMAAPVQAANNTVVDAETMAAVDTQVKEEIARLSKISPAVALAMKSEASKKQMYAIIAVGVLAAAGVYAALDYKYELFFFKKPSGDNPDDNAGTPPAASGTCCGATAGHAAAGQ